MGERDTDDTTARDKTKRGAIAGAAAGAVLGAVIGEGEADEILAGAAIGAGVGAGVGAYMDRQERELTEIPGTTVERVGDDLLLVHFDSDVMFEAGSSRLTARSHETLDDAVVVLNDYPKTAIVVQGHAGMMSNESEALRLSEERATAVRNYMISRGIDADRITAVGYGSQYADQATDNKRVDLLLKAKAA
jgi:outer membrane protein OmpA-like peptidoglycan-associated protein